MVPKSTILAQGDHLCLLLCRIKLIELVSSVSCLGSWTAISSKLGGFWGVDAVLFCDQISATVRGS